MVFETRDIIQILMIAFGAVATIATLRAESRRQSSQHAELKQETTARFDGLGRKVDGLTGTIASIMADSREHQVRIGTLEERVARSEKHIDEFGRFVFKRQRGRSDGSEED